MNVLKDDLRGFFAESRAGHDKGEVFIIIGNTAEYADIADGKSRTISKPKRKNLKHLMIRKEKLAENTTFSNEEIKYAIKGLKRKG